MKTLKGERLCGAVRFTVADAFRYALNCHCSQCRRATGAAFKSFAGTERPRLKVVAGSRKILRYGKPRAHIYAGSKAPWHAITDDLPQHDTLP